MNSHVFPKDEESRFKYESQFYNETKESLTTIYKTVLDAHYGLDSCGGWDHPEEIDDNLAQLKTIEDEIQKIYKKLAMVSLILVDWKPLTEPPEEPGWVLMKVQYTVAGKLNEGIIEAYYSPSKPKRWILPLGWSEKSCVEWTYITQAWRKAHGNEEWVDDDGQTKGVFLGRMETLPGRKAQEPRRVSRDDPSQEH